MKILHYALGFPPYRTGGLTKYCIDLMKYQSKEGNEVALLWPGSMLPFKKPFILKHKKKDGIGNYELVNPLPVALDEGIIRIDAYIQSTDKSIFISYLNRFRPDVIHIHTLMGLYAEFVIAAKELGITTVFTSHDYYGICPKVTLFKGGSSCFDMNCEGCPSCNLSALSLKKIIVMQSPIYRLLKDTKLVRKLRKNHRDQYFSGNAISKTDEKNNLKSEDYVNLRKFYIDMLNKVDIIHFNSSVSKKVYLRYLEPNAYVTIPITHGDISDKRVNKEFNHEILSLIYLGPVKEFKGFYFLIGVLDELWNMGYRKFKLNLYSVTTVERTYICHMGDGYCYEQLKDIFADADLLISPSMWYETFGFTILEAISHGVPVLVSENVGAKDIVSRIDESCVVPLNKDAFVLAVKELYLDRSKLKRINQKICNSDILPNQLPYQELYRCREKYDGH